jgi:hypothetical protein
MNKQQKLNVKKWWNNGKINKRSVECPDSGFVLGRLKFTRLSPSKETKQKISEQLKGNIPWNKGKTGVYSEETLQMMRDSKKGYVPKHKFKEGNTPWNKGLTVDTHTSVKSYVEKQKGQIREGEYCTGVDHPNFNPDRESLLRYKQIVGVISEKNYKKHKEEINPNDYPRGRCGIENAYQLDHIIPVQYGFENNIEPEIIGHKNNLQIIPWKDNLVKSNKY